MYETSLHDRRFMSQDAIFHVERDTQARSARQEEEKNKAPVRSPLFLLFRPLTPTKLILTTSGDLKRTNQNMIHYRTKIHLLGASVCIAVTTVSVGFAISYQSLQA